MFLRLYSKRGLTLVSSCQMSLGRHDGRGGEGSRVCGPSDVRDVAVVVEQDIAVVVDVVEVEGEDDVEGGGVGLQVGLGRLCQGHVRRLGTDGLVDSVVDRLELVQDRPDDWDLVALEDGRPDEIGEVLHLGDVVLDDDDRGDVRPLEERAARHELVERRLGSDVRRVGDVALELGGLEVAEVRLGGLQVGTVCRDRVLGHGVLERHVGVVTVSLGLLDLGAQGGVVRDEDEDELDDVRDDSGVELLGEVRLHGDEERVEDVALRVRLERLHVVGHVGDVRLLHVGVNCGERMSKVCLFFHKEKYGFSFFRKKRLQSNLFLRKELYQAKPWLGLFQFFS